MATWQSAARLPVLLTAVGTFLSGLVLASWVWILGAHVGDGPLATKFLTGSAGTLSDLGFAFYMVGLLALLAAIRRAARLRGRSVERSVFFFGLLTAISGTLGSAMTLWYDLVARIPSATGFWPVTAVALQATGALLLVVWCLTLGYLLRRSGEPRALARGVLGATFLGLPWWIAWLGTFYASAELQDPKQSPRGSQGASHA